MSCVTSKNFSKKGVGKDLDTFECKLIWWFYTCLLWLNVWWNWAVRTFVVYPHNSHRISLSSGMIFDFNAKFLPSFKRKQIKLCEFVQTCHEHLKYTHRIGDSSHVVGWNQAQAQAQESKYTIFKRIHLTFNLICSRNGHRLKSTDNCWDLLTFYDYYRNDLGWNHATFPNLCLISK